MKLFLIAASILLAGNAVAQVKNAKTESVKVNGNCAICKTNIEQAGKKNKLYTTQWDEKTKTASITFDSISSSLSAVLKNIALAGYDNAEYLAPADAYSKLQACCQYERDKRALVKSNSPAVPVEENKHSNEHHQPAQDTIIPSTQNPLSIVFDNYFAIKDALVNTNGNAASAKAAELLTSLDAINMQNLEPQQHTVWMKVMNGLKTDAGKISNSKDPVLQRQYFMTLSGNIYELMKTAKPSKHPFTTSFVLWPMMGKAPTG
jgi:Protein of unknown function (DUF3347).